MNACWTALLLLAALVALGSCGSADPLASQASPVPASRLAFVAVTGPANTDLFVINADGTGRRRLTDTPQPEFVPAWSPDGARLAYGFAKHRDPSTGVPLPVLYSMAADGSAPRRLPKQPSSSMLESWPSWSPDGTELVYVADVFSLWLTDAAGVAPPRELLHAPGVSERDPAVLANAGELLEPAWSPDGRRICFSGRDGLYVVDLDGTQLRRLTDRQGDTAPAWSPDGTRLAFSRWSVEQPTTGAPHSDIFLMHADGSEQRVLVATPADDTEPAWSPDGTQIAFVSAGAPQPIPTLAPPPVPTPGGPSGSPVPPATVTPHATTDALPTVPGTDTAYPFPGDLAGSPRPGLAGSTPEPYPPAQHAATPEPYRPGDIFIITLDGGSIDNLTNSPEHELSPTWQP